MIGAFVDIFSMKSDVKRAIDDISFDIPPGQSVGYVGPNGSGKTTTVKILTGILVPTSGSVRCGEFTPWRNRIRYQKRIGVVFGNRPQMTPELTVNDYLHLMRLMYEVPADTFDTQLKRLAEVLDIGPFLERPVRELSLGQRMRCEVAAAFVHRPEIVFLDEPSIGLDPGSKRALRALLRELNAELGTTLFFTSHDARDIEESCSRMILIRRGRVILDDEIRSIRSVHGGLKRAEIRGARFSSDGLSRLESLLGPQTDVAYHANTSTIEIGIGDFGSLSTAGLRSVLSTAGITHGDIHITEADLEDIIVKYSDGTDVPGASA